MSAKILILDDERINIVLLERMLENYMYIIESTRFPEEALQMIQDNNYDLVLSDVVMNQMSGFDFCRKARTIAPNLPVVLMTSMIEDDCIQKAFEAGAIDFINKPIRKTEIKMRIRNILKIKQTEDYLNLALNELNNKIRELEDMVIRDSMTNLYNHKYVLDRLTDEISRAARYNDIVSIIMFDLDHFKLVNDKYGHTIGDDVLLKVTDVLTSSTRTSDIAARYGGEEFLVVLPSSNLDAAKVVAEKIRSAIENLKWDNGLHVTISAGVTQSCGESATELLIKADSLLYQAKENGRNCVCC